MVHYSCDLCGRTIQERYTAKIEVAAITEDNSVCVADHDADYLDVISDELEALDSTSEFNLEETGPRVFEYDLCHDCCQQYLKAPLSPPTRSRLNYSQN